jgi:SAM-dependent methyltransferase
MDDIIRNYPFREFGDNLNYCYKHGLMYQRDMSKTVDYDKSYFENYVHREDSEIARKLNVARTSLSEKYCDCVVDVGVGSGEFIKKSKIKVLGYDINPVGVKWLEERGLFTDIYDEVPVEVRGFTLWDTLEHIQNPQKLLKCVRPGDFLFVSMPIFSEIEKVRESKHYKPGEHLYYFEKNGLIIFLDDSGFSLVEYNDKETQAGREGIGSFVFLKR